MRNESGAAYAANKYIELPVREETILMDFLLKQMGVSKNRAKDLLSGHAITVDRKLVTKFDHPLLPGEVVRISRHRRSTELTNKFVKIIYEDKYLIVIEKAPGILSMANKAGQYCVKTILDEYFTRRHFKCTAHVVHRLDRDTSGLMIYAKSKDVEQLFEQDWKGIVYDRRYVAVVSGIMQQEGGTETSYLRDNKACITYSSKEDNGGKLATTHYRRAAISEKHDLTLVELKLDTGRKNQIRVHMSDLGHPVCGDEKYGNGRNPVGRLALHAHRLYFSHPITGEDMRFETEFPLRFKQIFEDNITDPHR